MPAASVAAASYPFASLTQRERTQFAVPEKICAHPLDFFDRCTQSPFASSATGGANGLWPLDGFLSHDLPVPMQSDSGFFGRFKRTASCRRRSAFLRAA